MAKEGCTVDLLTDKVNKIDFFTELSHASGFFDCASNLNDNM